MGGGKKSKIFLPNFLIKDVQRDIRSITIANKLLDKLASLTGSSCKIYGSFLARKVMGCSSGQLGRRSKTWYSGTRPYSRFNKHKDDMPRKWFGKFDA